MNDEIPPPPSPDLPLRNLKLVISYDGTAYHGWETQKNGLAVQEVIEAAIRRITGESAAIEGSGRTDAGVHALAQVASFTLRNPIHPRKLLLALNAVLPDDVAIVEVSEVPPGFHARFSVTAKTYRYTILNDRARRPLLRATSYHFPQPLDVERMRAAAEHLVGTHDFRAFAKEAARRKNCVRTIFRADIRRDGPLIHCEFTGSGFLYNMIRILVGTLIDVGLGRRRPESFADLVEGRGRADAGFTVPACGLCLVDVQYDSTEPLRPKHL